MSRKSLSKKELPLWYLCINCNYNILAKDRDQHSCADQTGEILHDTLVYNKKLSTNQLSEKQITDDLKGIEANKLNHLLFLHESIFPLCDLVLGDFVLVSSPALSKNAPIVRIAWPLFNQTNGLVCVSQSGRFFSALIIIVRNHPTNFCLWNFRNENNMGINVGYHRNLQIVESCNSCGTHIFGTG